MLTNEPVKFVENGDTIERGAVTIVGFPRTTLQIFVANITYEKIELLVGPDSESVFWTYSVYLEGGQDYNPWDLMKEAVLVDLSSFAIEVAGSQEPILQLGPLITYHVMAALISAAGLTISLEETSGDAVFRVAIGGKSFEGRLEATQASDIFRV